MLNGAYIGERAGGRGRCGHTAAPVGDAVIKIVCTVAVSAVRGIEDALVSGPFGLVNGETHTVIYPVDQIVRGEYMVFTAAILMSPGNVHGAVEINAAVCPNMGLYIGDKIL
jgi:hypothetical protein